MFLFDRLPGGRWVFAIVALAGLIAVQRLLKHRRRREQLRRRRQIRARLHELGPDSEIDLTEPAREIDLRDGVIYGSEITLESGDTLDSGIVGPFPGE